ncbi:uncharacterized protein LOC129685772 [Psammomys obesus]|uniref:uncharacterized protein LOC129685772 n=1 Tax=Psammomys obesus TaxID=48139 RepID=UPI002452C4A6|nr:uncharacterized protein LOC129685772 [Psammomys obesus]
MRVSAPRGRPGWSAGGGPNRGALRGRGSDIWAEGAPQPARPGVGGRVGRTPAASSGDRGCPRPPAAGWVGGREGGRGRLADAAASWWADPESPRKRGRLSAVRQARPCGGGSPLLQRRPWRSPSVSAQPCRAPRAVNCSPAPPRLRPPSSPPAPNSSRTSAAARPAAPALRDCLEFPEPKFEAP